MTIEPSERHYAWIKRREAGDTYFSIAAAYGVKFQTVYTVVMKYRPDLMGSRKRPYHLARPVGFVHSEKTILVCLELWNGGSSVRQIAKAMTGNGIPITSNGVVGLANRQGFPARPSPIRRAT